ncbi:mercury(II) reductase [Thermogemmatispora tikiterensis]|uniref:Mercuric reductase n=1 Tax=Thermogemmatispora tikiterensis TaxID=1825093 RepID=A0A328VE25_9CHLR|nr:mercury(II) reductase [Thermogemmatispora tikiterensis]RAQ94262.1 mercury(II) reductase [Thermogemmatispora tikiterensis]
MSIVAEPDLLILGSGSTAFAAALHAADLGKTALLTEERTIGGTCANRGCLPSKNLIEAARLVYEAAHPRYPGLTPLHMPANWAELLQQKDALVQTYRWERYERLLREIPGLALVAGRAQLRSPHEVVVTGPDGTRHLRGQQLLIATGSRPIIPALPGLEQVPFLTSDLLSSADDPWRTSLRQQPRSLLILGGGAIALELGQLFARLGTRVTLLIRGSQLLPGVEPELAQTLAELLQAEGLRLLTGVQVQAVAPGSSGVAVTLLQAGRTETLEAEQLLVATGRRPNTDGLGLERAGVALEADGAVRVDRTLRTSVAHIWAAGDVIGTAWGNQFATPVGAADGKLAAHNALSGEPPRAVDHRVIPRCIFTDPPLAMVGLTDAQAQAEGLACACRVLPLSLVPRAGAIHRRQGLVKMVIERSSRRVLGVSLLGESAGEVIHEAAMALRFGARLEDFTELVHVYPTMAEALKLVALSFSRDVRLLSCCAS